MLRATLRELLVTGYDDLRKRLKRRLGSDDLAREILHETYLRLERLDSTEPVKNPLAYLFRIALNVAADRRAAARRLTRADVEAALHAEDHVLDPGQIAQARHDIVLLEQALEELTPRRRAIFVAARVHHKPHRGIAEEFGISTRMVEKELRNALEHCSARLKKNLD